MIPPASAGGTAPVVISPPLWLQSIYEPIPGLPADYVAVVMVYFAYGTGPSLASPSNQSMRNGAFEPLLVGVMTFGKTQDA